MATARNADLRSLARRVADALPGELVEEVVLTGSVSRGMADAVARRPNGRERNPFEGVTTS